MLSVHGVIAQFPPGLGKEESTACAGSGLRSGSRARSAVRAEEGLREGFSPALGIGRKASLRSSSS